MYSDTENIKDKIKKIQSDNTLTKEEKSKKIQELMMPKKKICIKCAHYPYKKCSKFSFLCCNNSYDCLRCHNEAEIHNPILDKISCTTCSTIQTPSNLCQNSDCNTTFSKNYCELCNLWTDVDIYHCKDCGLCRAGKKDSLFHCKNCDACYYIDDILNHKCKNKELRNEICVFCLETVYNSQDSYFSINCGHFVHNNCLKEGTVMNQVRCPQCRKSIYEMDWSLLKMMINIQPMPQEEIVIGDIVQFMIFSGKVMIIVDDILVRDSIITYKCRFVDNNNDKIIYANRESLSKTKIVKIYCNDCNKKSETFFHYLGNECKLCESFNTNII